MRSGHVPRNDWSRSPEYALAYMLDAESLFFDHFDDLKLKAGIEIAALPCHANLLGWWIVHLSRCPGKLDHYKVWLPAQQGAKAAARADKTLVFDFLTVGFCLVSAVCLMIAVAVGERTRRSRQAAFAQKQTSRLDGRALR